MLRSQYFHVIGKSFKRGVEVLSIIALLNRENAKKLEFHEISHPSLERRGYFKCPFKGANDNSPPFQRRGNRWIFFRDFFSLSHPRKT